MPEIYVTKHAEERAKQRAGWNRKTLRRMLPKIYLNGKRADSAPGFLKSWIARRENDGYDTDEYVLYGGFLFAFANGGLITVLNVPNHASMKKFHKSRNRHKAGKGSEIASAAGYVPNRYLYACA